MLKQTGPSQFSGPCLHQLLEVGLEQLADRRTDAPDMPRASLSPLGHPQNLPEVP